MKIWGVSGIFTELSEEFEVKVGVHQGSMLWALVFSIMVDVVTESVKNDLMSEMLYGDDLVLTSETMEGLREKFWKWKEAFVSKGLKVNLGKTKVVVSGAEGEMSQPYFCNVPVVVIAIKPLQCSYSRLAQSFLAPTFINFDIIFKGSGRYLNSSSVSLKSHNSLFVPGAQDNGFAVPVAPPSSPDPRYDWYQNDKIVTISVYTKKKDLRLEDIILELKDGKDFNAIFILGIKSFQIHLVLSNVVTCQQVRISGATGKADVLLTKETSGVKWTDLRQGLLGNNSLKLHKDRESRLWDCRVVSVEAVTHNCKLFCCELPDGIVMRVPMGHHIHLHRDVEGMKISRPYTVVLPSLRFSLDEREHDGRRFYLMIKIYPDGTLTPTLSAIDIGDILQISDYSGDFKESWLIEARDIILIAGGTGLTPMIRLIRRAVLESSSTEMSVKLLFANNQEKDILWKQQLNEMVETASQR
ncbi:cytochrome b5 reductase 4-like [Montipora foliosa]|uniref:cytochrome b5 reductase 4-like n=1 Tax=Montipora foliosa TaxID=591990 RepID=UPI0035F1D8EE